MFMKQKWSAMNDKQGFFYKVNIITVVVKGKNHGFISTGTFRQYLPASG